MASFGRFKLTSHSSDHFYVLVFFAGNSKRVTMKRKAKRRFLHKNLKDLKTFRLINQRLLGHTHHVDHASRMKQQYEDEHELQCDLADYSCWDDDEEDYDQVFCRQCPGLRHLDSVSRQVKLMSDTAEMFGVELDEIERFESSTILNAVYLSSSK